MFKRGVNNGTIDVLKPNRSMNAIRVSITMEGMNGRTYDLMFYIIRNYIAKYHLNVSAKDRYSIKVDKDFKIDASEHLGVSIKTIERSIHELCDRFVLLKDRTKYATYFFNNAVCNIGKDFVEDITYTEITKRIYDNVKRDNAVYAYEMCNVIYEITHNGFDLEIANKIKQEYKL